MELDVSRKYLGNSGRKGKLKQQWFVIQKDYVFPDKLVSFAREGNIVFSMVSRVGVPRHLPPMLLEHDGLWILEMRKEQNFTPSSGSV